MISSICLLALFFSAIRYPKSEIDAASGSVAWQIGFICFAVVLILVEIIRGWRLGVMRQLMRGVAVGAGYAAAYFGGEMLVPLLRSSLRMPDIIISMLGGAVLALLAYGIIAGLGTILFKRTAQQSPGKRRLIYGLTGGLLGIFFGAFFVWLILIGVRSIGAFADAQASARLRVERLRNGPRSGLNARPNETPSLESVALDTVTTLLARLKNSVEMGSVGNFVKKADAMPSGVYQTLNEAGTVLSNPETAQQFLSYPGARALSEHPKIVALREDREIADMIAHGRFFELMRHPKVVDAMNDPTLTEQVKAFDLKKALEYAEKQN